MLVSYVLFRRYLTRELIKYMSIFHKALKDGIIAILLFECWVLNKGTIGTIFNVFGITQSGIEPRTLHQYRFTKALTQIVKLRNYFLL